MIKIHRANESESWTLEMLIFKKIELNERIETEKPP